MNDETIQETSKTIGKGIDLAQKVGDFIAPLIAGSMEQGIGIFEDKLKYMRWERQIRLMDRAKDFMKERAITEINNPIPMKLAIPLLQGASLEENDNLQDLWAKLLVNSISNKGIELKRVYIDILERLSPLEAKMLQKIYDLPFHENQHKFILTYRLPEYVEVLNDDNNERVPPLNNPDVELALINLSRIGCISPVRTYGGGELYYLINLTLLGNKFYEACKL